MEIQNEIKDKKKPISTNKFLQTYTRAIKITNYLQQTISHSFMYVLYIVRNCSQGFVAKTCKLSLLSPNLQDVQLVYTYITSWNHILVITNLMLVLLQ